MSMLFSSSYDSSPGGVPKSYENQVVVCSECLQPQVFEGQCAGCHSEFGQTAWPYVALDILAEDMKARGLDNVRGRLRHLGSQLRILEVGRVFWMRCTAPWERPYICEDLGAACQFCTFWQYTGS